MEDFSEMGLDFQILYELGWELRRVGFDSWAVLGEEWNGYLILMLWIG